MPGETYRDLLVWQRAMDLAVAAYEMARAMPHSERFGLSAQMCRAAVSVPANIAEGQGRGGSKEFSRHLRIARGSLLELETHLTLAVRLNFINRESAIPVWNQSQEVSKMLSGLIKSLKRRVVPDSP